MRPLNKLSKAKRYALILEVLKSHKYNRTKAAKDLGISVRTVRNYIQDFRRRGVFIPRDDRIYTEGDHYHDCKCKLCRAFKSPNVYTVREKRDVVIPKGVSYCDKCGQKSK